VHKYSNVAEKFFNISIIVLMAYVFIAPDSSFSGIEKILDSANEILKIMVYKFWSPDIKEKIIDALSRCKTSFVSQFW